MPPHLKRVPFVPSSANEAPLPELALPARAELPAPDLPVLTLPDPPTLPDQPDAFSAGLPQHGHDWSGERPLQEELPQYRGAEEEPLPDLVIPACDAAPATLVRQCTLCQTRWESTCPPAPRFSGFRIGRASTCCAGMLWSGRPSLFSGGAGMLGRRHDGRVASWGKGGEGGAPESQDDGRALESRAVAL